MAFRQEIPPAYVLLVLITGTYPAYVFISTNYRDIPATYIIHTNS